MLLVLGLVAWRSIGSTTPRASNSPIEAPNPTNSEQDRSPATLLGAPVPIPRAGTAIADAIPTGSPAPAGANTYTFHVVADADGRPVPGAAVQTKAGIRLGTTDDAGYLSVTFRLPRLIGSPDVLVLHEGFVVETVTPKRGLPCEVRLVRGLPIRGRVVLASTGAPVPEARVSAFDVDSIRIAGDVTTDAEGRFRIDDARPDARVELVVRAPHRATVTTTAIPTPSSVEILVRLPAGGTLSGVVRDDAGRPLPGVAIFLRSTEGPLYVSTLTVPQPWAAEEQASTDASGRYEIAGIEDGPPRVAVARPRGLLVASSEPFDFEETGQHVQRDIRVSASGALRLTVDGLPLECEAMVRLHGEGLHANVTDGERARDGSWEFTELAPGRYEVGLAAAGFPIGAKEIEVSAGSIARLAFTFRGDLAVQGRVSFSDGRPAGGARIWWKGATSAWTVSDETGAFRFEGLDSTPGGIVAAPADGVPDTARAFFDGVRPGGDPVRLVLGSLPRVRLHPVGLPAGTRATAWVESSVYRGDADTSVGVDGALEVPVDQVGRPARIAWLVEGRAPLLTEVAPLAPGEVRDLGTGRFEDGRNVALRIVDEHDRPIPFAGVRLVSSWGELLGTAADAEGNAALPHVPEVAFLVAVKTEDRAPHLLVVPAGTAGPVVLRLEAEGTLKVHIVDREGAPAAKAYVQLLPAETDPYDPMPAGLPEGTRADDAGNLTLSAQARTYRARVAPLTHEGETTVGPLVVRPGETTTFEVRLP